ncbi:TPA: glycine--tRNA ligase [Candidatus Micrarchaeota archaeon]|nr:glycine--tRNA ligase [Candidatus Micrarchaeota archaeon]
MELHERIFELALTRSFFFPANEPYGSLSGFYDYGPVGALMKRKIENIWRRMFIKEEGFHEVETSIVTPEPVLKASGHVGSFADPVVECAECHMRIRGDTLVEETLVEKHGEKWDGKLDTIDKAVKDAGMKCTKCGGEFKPAYMFNLMFATGIGGDRTPAYNRPETAQGIFTLFMRLFRNHGTKLPVAAGQVGRSFRNEISPRKGLVRMREFTQMELEYFFNPSQPAMRGFDEVADEKMRMQINGKNELMSAKELVDKGIANEIMAYFLVREWQFYQLVGVSEPKMFFRVLDKNEIPHYSQANIDMEVQTSFGSIETIGNAYRTDFDLSQHAKESGKDFSVFVEEEKKKIVPHVVEVSLGVDRLFFSILEHCFREKTKEKDWEWFDFPPAIAPYDIAVFPLMKKDGMAEKAEEIAKGLREEFDVHYYPGGSIGKRYAKADEIGIPAAVTVDYDTLEKGTVTLRYRNNGEQILIKIPDISGIIRRFRSGEGWDAIKADYELVKKG